MSKESGTDRARWKLPPYIWHPSVRRACLEAAEQAWTEGYMEGVEQRRLQRLV
ncbi:hypothetical protein [Streptomyces neyagawaensis]|uniref:hypothetical protein n=1 Tax=Streptomyces neyagawaensis TaxID=42238 RepID=UPI000A6667FE|nr:hypothetical protein [Streptomyces neyagawaensis]MCL6732995.1 hypothetical protein [Streptomyces neyagawaensis]MDE1684856.1 hypothetical protein [Streptomyces neyagawaensis]